MKLFTFIAVLFFGFFGNAQTADDFVFTFDMTTSNSIRPFEITGTGSINIDWGDGTTDVFTNPVDQSISHTYLSAAIFTVIISDPLESFKFKSVVPLNILQWGNSQWKTMNQAFYECSYLSITASVPPDLSLVSDMSSMFEATETLNSNINISNWDVSNVTNMSFMFADAFPFNTSIGNWDVSSVTNMSHMFAGHDSFNQPLNNWDVSSVTDMSGMFAETNSFNQPLDNWDVSSVINMSGMFSRTIAFNQPLNIWDVSSVTDMSSMFLYTIAFNQPLNTWDVSNVSEMRVMFFEAMVFNQDLSSWGFNSNVKFISGVNTSISNASFVTDSGLDVTNYEALLQRFVQLNLLNNDTFYADGLAYCDSFSRGILIQNGWNIFGDILSPSCSNTILSGTVQYDVNNNGCDSNDLTANNFRLEITNSTNTAAVFTDTNGQYTMNLSDGTYTVTPVVDITLFTVAPANATVVIAAGVPVTEDFCLSATTLINDLEITILPLEDARPGFDTNYKLVYKNKGNTRLSGSVDFTYQDDFMDFLTATPATTSSSVGMLSWDFIDLDPFETREIEFSMNLNTPTDPTFPLNSNDLLDFNATINPITGDDAPLDNVFDLQQTVVNSYDPNDKTCLQGETILPTMVGEYVHYRIRFENEGTASAITVRIVDYIDTNKFDIATLIPLSASHDYTTTITEGNKVEFQFDNINLPFTAPASQGYVLFKIKTVDTLVLGDDFSNQAEIYFDFNFPIITNLETTTVAVPLSLNENNLLEVRLFPNPAQNTISLTSNMEFNEYTIYDTLGAIVSQEKFDAATVNKNILVDHLVSGLYFVEVKGDQSSFVVKMIKE
jgi:surface protein